MSALPTAVQHEHHHHPLPLLCMVRRRSCDVLGRMSRSSGHRFQAIDRLYLDLGWGYGHGAAHVVFFFVSLLPLTTGDGTWYNELCPEMNLFLVGALYSLGAGLSLPSLMVVGLEGWAQKKAWMVAFAPLMHLAMALTVSVYAQRAGRLGRRGGGEWEAGTSGV